MNLEAIIFAAHPDDVELSMGGTVIKLAKSGKRIGIIDLTMGELATRGTPEIRQRESFEASKYLKITLRENLRMEDGNIKLDKDSILKCSTVIRKYKPQIIFAPFYHDRHPDHITTGKLIKKVFFYTGLPKLKTFDNGIELQAYRPKKLYYYFQTYDVHPSFIVDISSEFEDKMKAIRCYSSQFYNPKSKEPETFISQENFIKYIEARAQYYGFKIGKNYGEPFYTEELLEYNFELDFFQK
jgi:bacillithiol biosynthesis deacetylase BshB1